MHPVTVDFNSMAFKPIFIDTISDSLRKDKLGILDYYVGKAELIDLDNDNFKEVVFHIRAWYS